MLSRFVFVVVFVLGLSPQLFAKAKFSPLEFDNIVNKTMLIQIECEGKKYFAEAMIKGKETVTHVTTQIDFLTTSGIDVHSLPPNYRNTFAINFNGNLASLKIVPLYYKDNGTGAGVSDVQNIISYLFRLIPPDGVWVDQIVVAGQGNSFYPLLGIGLIQPLVAQVVDDSKISLKTLEKIGFYDLSGIYRYYEIENRMFQTLGGKDLLSATTEIKDNKGNVILKYSLEVLK